MTKPHTWSTGAAHCPTKSITVAGQPETARSISTHCSELATDGSSRFLKNDGTKQDGNKKDDTRRRAARARHGSRGNA